MRAARWSGYLLLPIAFFLERFVWFGVRTVLWEHIAAISDDEVASAIVRVVSVLVLLSPLAGAAVGYAVGARRTLLIGMLSLCAGYLLLLEPGTAWPGAIVVALAIGLVRPAFLAVAGAVSPDPAESPRTTLFLLLYAATTAAALGGPALTKGVRGTDLFWLVGGAAVCLVIATAFAGIHLGAVRMAKAVEPAPRRGAFPLVGAVVLLAISFFAIAMLRTGAGLLQSSSFAGRFPATMHPGAVIAILFMLGLVWIGLSAGTARVPAVVPAAIGMILLAISPLLVGVSLLQLSGGYRDLLGFAFLGASILLAAGEALVMAFLLSRISSGAPPKAAVAVTAAWILTTSLSSAILGRIPDAPIAQGIAFLLAAAAGLVIGIWMIVRRRSLRALFEGPIA